jgi:hypothetical protein
VIRPRSWHRWTSICLVACIYLAVALWPQEDASSDGGRGTDPEYRPELLRLLRDTAIRPQLPYPQSVIVPALEQGQWLE